MQPFVTSMDPSDFGVFLQMVEGKMPDKHTALHVALDVASFAAGQISPDPAVASPAMQFAAVNAKLAALPLGPKALAANLVDVTAKKINWGNVLKVLLPILLQLLGGLVGGGAAAPSP